MTEEQDLEFSPISTGSMTEIPPDAPAGEWVAEAKVKPSKTQKDGRPMLIVEWTIREARDPFQEEHIGKRVTDFIVFWDEKDKASRMAKVRMREMCTSLGIESPDTSSFTEGNWGSMRPFIEALEAGTHTIFTKVETSKAGEQRAVVTYTRPKPRF